MAEHSDYALHIFAGQDFVGELFYHLDSDTFGLTYDPDWVANPRAYALSPPLALTGEISALAIRRFLENLLPEGRALDIACNFSNIQKNNIFALIRLFGSETAGALTFLAAGTKPEATASQIREITFAELQERIAHRRDIPFTVWDAKVRMSVAGFQDKLLVNQVGQRLFLVDGSLSSTHILKPEPLSSVLPLMVANEHFCMALASRISRRRFAQDHVAQVDILRVPDPVLSITRFDRQAIPGVFAAGPDDVKIPVCQRVHIIDGCQAMGLPVSAKYERNMGVGKDVEHIRDGLNFEKLFACREFLEQPLVGIRRLVLWQATTLLFGNSDAHGKNISFYAGRAGLRVAELYDLVSVQQYDPQKLEHALSMAFGDEFVLDAVKSFALADSCERSKVSRSFFARELAALCEIARQEAPLQALDPIYQGAEVEMVASLAAFVVQQATRLQALTKDIPKFKKDVF